MSSLVEISIHPFNRGRRGFGIACREHPAHIFYERKLIPRTFRVYLLT